MTELPSKVGVVTDEAGRGAVYEGHGPQGLYDEETHTTYVVYRGPDADPYATAFDHAEETFATPSRIGTNPLNDRDNHGPPSVMIDDDGYLIVFYGSHGRYHQIARSSEPYAIDEWEDLGEMDDVVGGTYPNPINYDGDIYVMYRAGPTWDGTEYPSAQFATIAKTSDRGDSFEDLGPIIDSTGHPDPISITYVKDIEERDGRFHISWFICHDHAVPVTADGQHRSGIYHALYDPAEDAMYDLAGNRYERPITWEDMQGTPITVFDSMDVNHPKHVVTEEGPIILYGHYDPATINFEDDTSRIEWLVSSWREGYGWWTERLVDVWATHLFDGGYPRLNEDGQFEAHIVTGGEDQSLVDGSRGGNFEVFRKANGEWQRETVATADEMGVPLSRVSTVKNGRDAFASMFQPRSSDAAAFDIPLYAYGSAWQ